MVLGNQTRQYQVGSDLHLQLGDPPLDAIAAQESCRIDASADREWFARHPNAKKRERLASIRELKAQGMPPGSRVVVLRGPHGQQARMFVLPDSGS